MAVIDAETASSEGIGMSDDSTHSLFFSSLPINSEFPAPEIWSPDSLFLVSIRRAGMGAKESRLFFDAIVYNNVRDIPESDKISTTEEFVKRMVGIPVTIEHALEGIHELFDTHSSGSPDERIATVQEFLENNNYSIGNVMDARISDVTGSVITTISMKSAARQLFDSLKISPEKISMIGTSLTHTISSGKLLPIEVALTANPARPGCRILVDKKMADLTPQQKIAAILNKLPADKAKELESALETSKVPEILKLLNADDIKTLAESVPGALALEMAVSAPAAAANTPAAATAAASSGGKNVEISAKTIQYVSKLLGDILNGGDNSVPAPEGMSEQGKLEVLAYSVAMRMGSKGNSSGEPAPKKQQTMDAPQQPSRLSAFLAPRVRTDGIVNT